MKNTTKFSEMQVGRTYETDMLLTAVTQRAAKNSGNIFLKLTLSDGETTNSILRFNYTEADLERDGIEVGNVVRVSINVTNYNGGISYICCDMWPVTYHPAYAQQFIPKANINVERCFSRLMLLLESNKGEVPSYAEPLASLAQSIIIQNKDAFIKSAAGLSVHHATLGGLLEHSLSMAEDAARYCDMHPELDKELLIVGAALHDIGKIRSLSTTKTGAVHYSSEGRLIDHSTLGLMIIEETWIAAEVLYPMDRILKLEHLILNHHGVRKPGDSPLPETLVLHSLDMADAKINSIQSYNYTSNPKSKDNTTKAA